MSYQLQKDSTDKTCKKKPGTLISTVSYQESPQTCHQTNHFWFSLKVHGQNEDYCDIKGNKYIIEMT